MDFHSGDQSSWPTSQLRESVTAPLCNATFYPCALTKVDELVGPDSIYSECRRNCRMPCDEKLQVESSVSYSAYPHAKLRTPSAVCSSQADMIGR